MATGTMNLGTSRQTGSEKNTLEKTSMFTKWYESIKDKTTKRRVRTRIRRAEEGHFGVTKSVSEGVREMIFESMGIRIYYFVHTNRLYWLLAGGDKSSQTEDVRLAKMAKLRIQRGESC